MARPDVKALLEAGVHFGHRTEKWNPKMKPFIFEARNGIYVIDLTKTVDQLATAGEFLRATAAKGGKILFVGCKKQAQEAIKETSGKTGCFHVTERWLGGTLTNLNTVRKSVARMRYIDSLEDDKAKAKDLTKAELGVLRREAGKIRKNLDGIKDMERAPDAIVIVDIVREDIAVREARRLKIPIVAITDTNADPTQVEYPIAGNDDAIRSIRSILDYLAQSITEGNASRPNKAAAVPASGEPAPAPGELEAVSA